MLLPATHFARAQQPLLLGIGFAVLILVAGIAIYLMREAHESARLIAQTLEQQRVLSTVLLNLRRAESAQRGYLLTRNTDYLENYQETRRLAIEALDELGHAGGEAAMSEERLAEADRLLKAKMAELDETLRLANQGEYEKAVALLRTNEGRKLMDDLRLLLEEASEAKGRLLTESTAESQATRSALFYLTLFAVALILSIGGLSVWLMQRANRERQRAQAELESTNANLETIIEYRTADLTEANEEIQRFAYIVSHDLRSPLVNIMGFTTELEALRQDIFDEVAALRERLAALTSETDPAIAAEAAQDAGRAETLGKDFDEAVGFIKASIVKMDKLINAVLKLSREGRREFRPEYIDMTAMLRTLEKSVTHQAQEAGATVTVGDVPPVTSDRLALEQIFSNLLDNAVKYLRRDVPGEIEVSGRATMTHAVYEVRDNGRGIAKADHQRIFDLFRRAGEQDRAGDGIGLAHVRALVRRLGGTLSVESELGKGSAFTVTLPRRWAGEQKTAEQRSAA